MRRPRLVRSTHTKSERSGARFDSESALRKRGLTATANLFQRLSEDTAARMGFALAKPQDDYLHALGVMVSPSVSASSATEQQASKASS